MNFIGKTLDTGVLINFSLADIGCVYPDDGVLYVHGDYSNTPVSLPSVDCIEIEELKTKIKRLEDTLKENEETILDLRGEIRFLQDDLKHRYVHGI